MKRVIPIRQATARGRALRDLFFRWAVYWAFLAGMVWLQARGSRDFDIALVVAWVVSAMRLSMQVSEAAELVDDGVGWVWAVGTFAMGPFGAVVFPTIQAWKLIRD
jgi:hypothetical protein